jgi:serine/threonine-protein kinase
MSEWRVTGFTEVVELGAGSQGRAVLVRDGQGQALVLKYLWDSGGGLEAFRRESMLLKQIRSPHVVRWYGHYEGPAGAAILMEAVEGVSLRAALDQAGRLSPETALTVLKGSLLGLAAAHEGGIVHRDYKPGNVMVDRDGCSKLLDFGIAALSGSATGSSGTPAYMAPEQWEHGVATPATDIYAATCVFLECVTGERPYPASDPTALRLAHLNAPIPLQNLPAELHELVATGLAKQAADRPPTAAEFVTLLEAAASGAYGPDWERRGAAALATAAASLAAALPIAVLLGQSGTTANAVSAGAGGVTKMTGGGTGKASGIAKISTAKAGLFTGSALAVGAAVVVGVTVIPSHKHHPAKPSAAAAPVSIDLASYSEAFPAVRLQAAGQYVQLKGLRNTAAQTAANQALRHPLDWAVAFMKTTSATVSCTQDGRVRTSLRFGERGPKLLSVFYQHDVVFCSPADGRIPADAVTVDLTTGRVLSPDDVFLPAAFTQLWARVANDRTTWSQIDGGQTGSSTQTTDDKQVWTRGCSTGNGFERANFLPGKDPSTGLTDPPRLKLIFTPGNLKIINSIFGSDQCIYLAFTVPYTKIQDLLKPDIIPLLPK